MADINLDVNYFEHVKIKRLIYKLGEGAESIPIRLWCYAAKHYPKDGIFKGLDGDEIISVAGIKCNKDTTSILKALLEVGIIEKMKSGYKLHQWEEYQGHIVAFKIRGTLAAKKRWEKLKPKPEPMTPSEQEAAWKPKEIITIIEDETFRRKNDNH